MSGDSYLPHILNLSNSIIGVTMLAMPFCFKECGMILGTLLLFFCTWLTLSSCQMLMKAGLSSKKRSYGFLAYHTHGYPGKLAVEVGMIGIQLGTLVAQVVVIGDLGPAIISKFTGIENSSNLRSALIILMCIGVGLPLGLLKNLSSVSKASTLCICFYASFVVYMVSLSLPNLLAANWYSRVHLWKTDGLFKCLPIFSFAFGCQTQLFLLYDSMIDPSLKGINSIVGSAVHMCTVSYLLVGFFGYISFCDTDITGDIINHLPSSYVSDLLKLGFVISIAITFPLIIFPCRSCLYTLLFPEKRSSEDIEQRPVLPELHFKVLTVLIVLTAVVTGILVPNVEFVLAINGATAGTLIWYIFPAMFFLRVMTGSSEGKNIAQFVFVCGFTIMLLCTYTTLNTQDKGHVNPVEVKPPETLPLLKKDVTTVKQLIKIKDPEIVKESRIEPPNPRAPVENKSENDKIEDRQKLNISIKDKDEKVILPSKDTKNGKLQDTGIIPDKNTDVLKDKETVRKKESNIEEQNEILNELKKQHEEQQRLINEQRKILDELKEHKEEHKNKSLLNQQSSAQINVQQQVPDKPNLQPPEQRQEKAQEVKNQESNQPQVGNLKLTKDEIKPPGEAAQQVGNAKLSQDAIKPPGDLDKGLVKEQAVVQSDNGMNNVENKVESVDLNNNDLRLKRSVNTSVDRKEINKSEGKNQIDEVKKQNTNEQESKVVKDNAVIGANDEMKRKLLNDNHVLHNTEIKSR